MRTAGGVDTVDSELRDYDNPLEGAEDLDDLVSLNMRPRRVAKDNALSLLAAHAMLQSEEVL